MHKSNIIQLVELLGGAGIYVYFCKRFKIDPVPFRVPIFGSIRTLHEIRNIIDNFGVEGQLRNETVESYLSKKQAPVVVDCGVNVGISVRWWFHINHQARIYGIDMIEEAQKFTVTSIGSIGVDRDRYTPIVAALWSENGMQFKIGVSDPLYGDYGFYRQDKEQTERVVTTKTLDTIFDPENIGEIDLLKVDLEGAAADVLKGAARLLTKTKYIVFEIHAIHNKEECRLASSILSANNFLLIHVASRNLWWERSPCEDIHMGSIG